MSDERKRLRSLYGVECPVCKEQRPKTNASILLPSQRCKVDGYRDPRKREYHNEYLHFFPREQP